ncbi:hypothetical protein [Aureimonas psammosilenae]|uniref:hypothetical protein n=1 Tax=Aureimonas psammosilenae TaxID=2495496 RepID=UPI001260DD7B|nr:hypothetical protein [Aureimonas psammosilenae]
MSSTHDPNADRARIATTRDARRRAEFIASSASTYLRYISTACSSDGEIFARLQASLHQNLSQAIIQLASVRNNVEELEGLLLEIDAAWSGREPEAPLSNVVAVSNDEEAK